MKKMNNKGFSLIELIIVIAIMAILVAIIAPNLTKYLGKSKKNTDKKNADEIAQQLQTAISDYESQDDASGINADFTVTWAASGVTVSVAAAAPTGGQSLQDIIASNITSSTKSKETNNYASADVKYDSTKGAYKITVTVGNASAVK